MRRCLYTVSLSQSAYIISFYGGMMTQTPINLLALYFKCHLYYIYPQLHVTHDYYRDQFDKTLAEKDITTQVLTKKKKEKKRQHHFEVYRLNHQFWHIDCPAEEQLDVRDKEIQWQVGCVVNLTKTTGNTV